MLERSLDGDRGLVGMLGRWKRRRLIREQEDRLQQLEERMELMLEGSLCVAFLPRSSSREC